MCAVVWLEQKLVLFGPDFEIFRILWYINAFYIMAYPESISLIYIVSFY